MTRPEIPPILATLIDAAFGRTRTKLRADMIGHEKRSGAVDQLSAIKDAVLAGAGEIPYLAQLGLPADDGAADEMRVIIQLLEAVQALAEWQIGQPTLVDAHAVREFFLRVDRTAPWMAPAQITFYEGNVSPFAQRVIRRLGRFQSSTHGGAMVQIVSLVGREGGAAIWVLTAGKPSNTGHCPPQIQFDADRQIWDVMH
jgi:hypothetical protein